MGAFGAFGPSVRYEAYVLGGMNGSGFSATSGIRGGRVRERPSLNEPAVTGRVDLYPFVQTLVAYGQSLRVGGSVYRSGLDNGNEGNNPGVGGSLFLYSADLEYALPFVGVRGAFAHEFIGEAEKLGGGVASEILGWYGEAGVPILPASLKQGKLSRAEATLFVRYDDFDTQYAMPAWRRRQPERRPHPVDRRPHLLAHPQLRRESRLSDRHAHERRDERRHRLAILKGAPMRTIITLAAALLWTFLGCASAARTMPSAEAIIAAGVADGADAESLRRGRLLAATACAQCHRIYWPQEYSSLVWPELLRDMGRRASFTEPQVNDVIAYFVAAAKAEEKERADQESR